MADSFVGAGPDSKQRRASIDQESVLATTTTTASSAFESNPTTRQWFAFAFLENVIIIVV
jgi:hypothetical protein